MTVLNISELDDANVSDMVSLQVYRHMKTMTIIDEDNLIENLEELQ